MTMTSAAAPASPTTTTSSFNFNGKILRKKNISPEYLKLAILEDGKEKSTTVYIPRKELSTICTPSEFNFLYLDATAHVQGDAVASSTETNNAATLFHHVTQCSLVRCAPNIKMIKEVLALPDYSSFASTMNMDEEELRCLVEGDDDNNKPSQKIVINTIIERITGKRAKAPPRYRPGRVRQSDMEILEQKEAEGKRAVMNTDDSSNSNTTWRLCQPCSQSSFSNNNDNNTIQSSRKRKEEVVNLPTGADHSISAHGKLTRSEYLETKKNHQAMWFVERMRQLFFNGEHESRGDGGGGQRAEWSELEPRTRTILDVGGGRGDLAVRIAISFPFVQLIVVDCNESSIEAGREYAAKCGVEDRIEFLCMNFTEYVERYNNNVTAGEEEQQKQRIVDFVVALHACGDLSDLALSFASSHNQCDFIICPCCYPKRYLAPFVPHWHGLCKDANEVDSLSRLVELDDHREVSRRAMLVINSMRQSGFACREERVVRLEEFDDKISKRNIALVGYCRSS